MKSNVVFFDLRVCYPYMPELGDVPGYETIGHFSRSHLFTWQGPIPTTNNLGFAIIMYQIRYAEFNLLMIQCLETKALLREAQDISKYLV